MNHVTKLLIACIVSSLCINLYPYRRYVLTGPQGNEKASVVAELKKSGYQTTQDAYTVLHEQAKSKDLLDASLKNTPELYSNLMTEQIKLESAVDPLKSAFLDGSTVDIIARGDFAKLQMPQGLRDKARKDYDLIFFLDPSPKPADQKDASTKGLSKEASEVHHFLKEEYKKKGYKKYQLIDVPYGTAQTRAQFVLDKINKIYFFADIIDCFAGKNSLYKVEDFIGPVKLITITGLDKNPYHFFGVEKNQQDHIPFKKFKDAVARKMGVNPQNMLEIVGDSAQFSEEGSNFVRKYLREKFAGNHIIEFGFTGYIKGKELDLNSFLNEYVDEDPSQAYKVLANILGHTHTALTQWGTVGSSHIRNFVVVYTNDGMTKEPVYNQEGQRTCGFTTFGDDIKVSDDILQSKEGDRLVCVEGGVQSFRQVINALTLDVPVDLVYNVRTTERELLFSAARFLSKVKGAFKNNQTPSPEDVQKIYDTYKTTFQNIWDPSKPDYLTKKALFETAIQDFVQKGIYKKVNTLCTFVDAITQCQKECE